MAKKKYPSKSGTGEPFEKDNLQLINGIGPGVEKRLNDVGVFTFAQLAAPSPADIAAAVADLAGMSTERIIKQDWIGQARKLAEEPEASESFKKAVEAPRVTEQNVTITAPVEPPTTGEHAPAEAPSLELQKDAAPSTADYRPAIFTVELLLDEHDKVHSTHVIHAQSGREQTWTGWPKTEFVDFLDKSVVAKIWPEEPVPPKTEEPIPQKVEEPVQTPALVVESKPFTPEAAQPGLAGTLLLRELKIIGTVSADSRSILSREQPLDANLVLDLTEITVSGNTALNYKASIYGKSRVGGSGQVVGEAKGTIEPGDTVTIDVKGNPLPEGIYRLAATVVLSLPGMKPIIKRGMLAVIDGGQIQVY